MQGEILNSLLAVGNVTGEVSRGWNALTGSLATSFGELTTTFASGFIKIVIALLILFIGRIIARIIRRAVEKVLEVARFNEGAEKLNVTDMLRRGNIDSTPASLLSKFIYYTIMLFVMIATFDYLGWNVISEKFADLIDYLPRLLIAGVIFTLGFWVANFVRDFAVASLKSVGSASTANIVGTGAFWAILVMATVTALNQAGINTNFLTQNVQIILGAVLFALALAYGLAARGTMEDLISGFFNKKKFDKGQRIRVGEVEGEVVNSDNVSVTVRTGSNTVVIPMKELSASHVHIL